MNNNEPSFLIVSEEEEWKNEIKNTINNIALKYNKKIKIIEIDYTNEYNIENYTSVLDMFCLSMCKEILQGVKYSSFSIISSIIGNNRLENYTTYLKDNKEQASIQI